MSNGQDSIFELIKVMYYKMSQHFPKEFRNFGGNVNLKVNLPNYATKSDMKNISHVDTSRFLH